MRHRVVVLACVRAGAQLFAGTLVLAGCSFDMTAMPSSDEHPVTDDGGREHPRDRHDAAAVDAARDTDMPTPPLADAEPPGPVRPDEPMADAAPTPDDAAQDAAMDAAADADADAANPDDDASVDEPDAAEPCDPDPGPCVCPHEAVLDPADQCGPALCPVDACAPDDTCRFLRFASSGYYFCDDERSWEQARMRCDAIEGAHLASIESADEDQFVFEQIDAKTWLGGNDRTEEGRWRWTAGSAFYDEDSGPIAGAFENWHSTEPNDTGLSETAPDCLMYWYENTAWADASCGDPHGYVCEVD